MTVESFQFTTLPSTPRVADGEPRFRYEFEVGMELERTLRGMMRALIVSGCQPIACTYDCAASLTNLIVVGTRAQIQRLQEVMATIDLD